MSPLMTDDDIRIRMENPINLMNRLRDAVNVKARHPAIPPTADEIIEDLDSKLEEKSLKSKATALLSSTLDELSRRLPEVTKPEKLATIAKDMSAVLDNQNKKDRIDSNEDKQPQIIIYAPQMRQSSDYVTINVND